GQTMLQWGHVRLFSPWRYLIDREAAALLATNDWCTPDPEGYPTGRELVEQYLLPLAQVPVMQVQIALNTCVVSVTRQGFDKMKSAGREHAPFVLRLQSNDGTEREVLARAVIDASGTYSQPNPLGASGVFALGQGYLKVGAPSSKRIARSG
ncbi:MAG TPA: flavoprotein, partial [Ktedonobacteraceae bacterium]